MTSPTPLIHPPLLEVDPAPASARKHLFDAIRSQHPSLSPAVATVISEAATFPSQARGALASPLSRHTPYGVLHLLPLRVYAPLAVPGIANPRLHAHRTPPFADPTARPPLEPALADPSQPILRVSLEDRDHGEQALRETRAWLTGKEAADLEALIRPYGVQVPVTLVVQEFAHDDGSESVHLLAGLDGSTRISICHSLLGMDTADVPYRMWTNGRTRGRVLREIAEIGARPADELVRQPDLVARHRALTIPASIVIGFEPNPGGSYEDIVSALDSLVSMEHLGHARDWDESSQQDELSRIALREAVAAGVLTERERLYMLGALTKDDCIHPPSGGSAVMLPVHEDERAVFISAVVHSPEMRAPISRAYHGLLVKDEDSQPGRLPKNARVDIAAELTFLTFRNEAGEDEVERRGPRSILYRTWAWTEFRNKLRRPTGRTPEELRDAALAELHANGANLGPDRVELAMAGAYWLIAGGVLKRDSRDTDNRSGIAVLKAMLSCEDGLHQLYQAIVDGRAGTGEIQEVEPGGDGAIRRDGHMVPIAATDRGLRASYSGVRVAPGVTPEDELRRAVTLLRTSLEQAGDAVTQIKDLVDANGVALFLEAALSSRDVGSVRTATDDVSAALQAWATEIEIEQRVRAGRARTVPRVDVLQPPAADPQEVA